MAGVGAEATGWIVAVTGMVTGVGALILNRRSQKEQHVMQQAANQIASDKSRLEETEQAITSLEKALARADAEIASLHAAKVRAETERDEKAQLHRAMYAAQEARCREYAQDLTDALLVLRRVVTDEIARSAASTVLEQPGHPHGDPPTAPAAGEEGGSG